MFIYFTVLRNNVGDTPRAGFEPTHPKGSRLAIWRVNHSAIWAFLPSWKAIDTEILISPSGLKIEINFRDLNLCVLI